VAMEAMEAMRIFFMVFFRSGPRDGERLPGSVLTAAGRQGGGFQRM